MIEFSALFSLFTTVTQNLVIRNACGKQEIVKCVRHNITITGLTMVHVSRWLAQQESK